jgi:hypothetical protein
VVRSLPQTGASISRIFDKCKNEEFKSELNTAFKALSDQLKEKGVACDHKELPSGPTKCISCNTWHGSL